ncbi:MAG: hypothetical protein ACOCYU_04945 [Brevefilum sp.]
MAVISLISTACGLTDFFSNYIVDRGQNVEKQVELTLTALGNAAEESTPEQPQPTSTPSVTPSPTVEDQPQKGVISGDLYYPSEGIPPLRIVAFEVGNFDNYISKEIRSGSAYQLEVPAGTYYVLAYLLDPGVMDPDFSGAYSEFVLCGLQASCEDHSLVPVEVQPGETVSGIDLADWYLPPDQSDLWPSDPFAEATGGIQGNLGYPSEYIPPMRVVAFDVNSSDYYYVDTLRNQDTYEITGLPPGIYHVVAYVHEQGPDLAGGYSYFVTCGMTQDCENHRLIDVNVDAGQVTEGVDPVDFYIQPDEVNWPENPTE